MDSHRAQVPLLPGIEARRHVFQAAFHRLRALSLHVHVRVLLHPFLRERSVDVVYEGAPAHVRPPARVGHSPLRVVPGQRLHLVLGEEGTRRLDAGGELRVRDVPVAEGVGIFEELVQANAKLEKKRRGRRRWEQGVSASPTPPEGTSGASTNLDGVLADSGQQVADRRFGPVHRAATQ